MVTISLMAEYASDSIFVFTPVFRGRRFTSLFLIEDSAEDIRRKGVASFDEYEDVLYLCSYEASLELAAANPKLWVLGVAGRDVFEPERSSSASRLACVRTKESAAAFYVRLQRLFLRMERWETQTRNIILAGGGVQEILDEAETLFKNYISLSNANFELVARTKNIEIDDPRARELIEKGRHSEATIALFRASGIMNEWEKRSRIAETAPLISSYHTLDYVYRRRGRYYMHLIMHCNNEPVSMGLADMFQMLVDLVEMRVRQSMESDAFAGNDLSRLMDDVMLHRAVPLRTLERRARAAGISLEDNKRLVVMGFSDPLRSRSYLPYFARSASEALSWCKVGIYGNYVVALMTCQADWNARTDALEAFANENPCLIGVSNSFTHINDLSLAFQQAKAALELMMNDQPSYGSLFISHRHHALFFFEDYFSLCALDAIRENELLRLSAQRGTVVRIARFDEQHGTDDLRILFVYLKNERDARKTSEELYIHRSTLLYRIKRMQDRFALDLDDYQVRQRLMLEFFLCKKAE